DGGLRAPVACSRTTNGAGDARAAHERRTARAMPAPLTSSVGAALRGDLVARAHAGQEVVVDVAVEEPDAGVVGRHVGGDHARREQRGDVGAHAHHGHGVAVPVRRVQIHLGAHARQVPADALALARAEQRLVGAGRAGAVAVDVAVDRVHQIALVELLVLGVHVRPVVEPRDVVADVVAHVLVHHAEGGHELAVDADGRAVGLGLAAGVDDDRAHEPGVDVGGLVDVGVVHPHDGVAVRGPGPGALGHQPRVDVLIAWRHGVVGLVGAGGAVVV